MPGKGRRPPARRRPTTPKRPRSTLARPNGAASATPCASTPRPPCTTNSWAAQRKAHREYAKRVNALPAATP
ncbi:hypothetical protein ACFQY7_10935 [Actinomadura luteofluorescens]|uniref:hypothetical protein n=1 Tax=Actinomadura luteofluorescens TaxID=46163 RepID=UPI00364007AE